ncbi:DUF2971 domain-containing protein [Devosia nitrariae]|uniref:DUF2971 domain-containing protein n=1 Tax=Devosia nitrariae TaxID=2071872 RepID=A0ABQ5W1N0_9HYPH|nr:DUF2971 domain-containing protein [Devosia nitrariae]GLQ53626.1 hypothetical protein GCM10010862_08850 [Devosia nitrariae]
MADIDNPPPITQIFFGQALGERARIVQNNKRFVHYTSAEAAFSMIKNAEVWMRKSSTMNDFSEIEHGIECLFHAYKGPFGERLKRTLENAHPNIVSQIAEIFDSWLPHFRLETYLTCISEHEDKEDRTGRLSMWRAYGNVAIVLNKDIFMSETDALKAYSSPVAYLYPHQFEVEFGKVVERAEAASSYLATLDRELVVHNVFSMFRYAVLCTKHPGFHEEREWRVIYSPTFELSPRIKKTIEVIRGVPQAVCKIPLSDAPDDGLNGIEIPKLVNRVIIGPSQYPFAQLEAFIYLLEERGMSDARERVWVSDVPLRQP